MKNMLLGLIYSIWVLIYEHALDISARNFSKEKKRRDPNGFGKNLLLDILL